MLTGASGAPVLRLVWILVFPLACAQEAYLDVAYGRDMMCDLATTRGTTAGACHGGLCRERAYADGESHLTFWFVCQESARTKSADEPFDAYDCGDSFGKIWDECYKLAYDAAYDQAAMDVDCSDVSP